MTKIKVKEHSEKTIKTLDKTIAWTERIKDPIVYANEKAKDTASGQENPVDYGADKIKYISNRTKDETIYASKKAMIKGKKKAIEQIKKKKINPKTNPEKIKKKIQNTQKTAKKIEKSSKETAKITKRMFDEGKKLAIKGSKATVKGIKTLVKACVSAIKGIIAGVKSLISALVAGGSVAAVVVLIICLIGLLVASMYGIFFSSEDIGNNIKISDCISELNQEMDNKIKDIENQELHDEVVIESNKAEWKDVLSIYTVRVSNGNQEQVMIIDQEKKKILKEVFWDMNIITYEIKTEESQNRTIDSWDKPDFENQSSNIKRILHIYINHNSLETIQRKYNFNSIQEKQLKELTSNKYSLLWTSAIYGSYGSSGEFSDWKQKGREWSDVKIGNSNKTIGQVGCLVTSIAILIKKSGVSTSNIIPFNPGTFVTALNNVYAFDGANLMYAPISKVVPNFQYGGKVYLTDKTKNEKLYEIKKYSENGYYLAIEVLGATDTAQHWVALDRVNNNTILMIDPGSDGIDLWKQYDWNLTSQFVYFKVTK